MLSDERLAEIKARAEAATPGPWNVYEGESLDGRPAGLGWIGNGGNAVLFWRMLDLHPYTFNLLPADAALAAHARQDIPDLVAEVERLQRIVDEVMDWKVVVTTRSTPL